MRNYRVQLIKQDYGLQLVFGIFEDRGEKQYLYDGKGTWKEYEYGKQINIEDNCSLILDGSPGRGDILQGLANVIGELGYYAEKVKPLQNELQRVESHLSDAITIRDRLLTIIEMTQKIRLATEEEITRALKRGTFNTYYAESKKEKSMAKKNKQKPKKYK